MVIPMSRRFLALSCLVTLFATLSCQRTVEETETSSAGVESAANVASDDATSSEGAVPPTTFDPQDVEVAEGVRSIAQVENLAQLEAHWTECTRDDGVTIGSEGQRFPVSRLLWNDGRLYVASQNEQNELVVEALTLTKDEESCHLSAATDFATNGRLELGAGAIDVDFFDDLLVATGTSTRVFRLDGSEVEICGALPSLTRLRGEGAHGVARRAGREVMRVTIDENTCTVNALPPLSGEEELGMLVALRSPSALYATLHHQNVPNAFAYIENGKIQWRFFPEDDAPNLRVNLITGLTGIGEDVLVIRSLPQSLQVWNAEGEMRAEFSLKAQDGPPTLEYPYTAVALDDSHAAVVFRIHERDSEDVSAALRILTIREKN